MTRVIGVIGGKGGIGKTTLVSNLSCALAALGQNVVAIDTNMTTPNLGLHLGLHLSPQSLHDVLKGRAKMHEAMYPHPGGFKVVPASMAVDDLQGVDIGKLPAAVMTLYGKTDFVILDCGAGLGREALSSIKTADEILLITNPDLPSVADALKTVKIVEDSEKKILGVVLNRVRGSSHELTVEQVEKMLGYRVVSQVPDDRVVPKAISMKVPIFLHDPHSPAAVEFNRLAHMLVGKHFAHKPRSKFGVMGMLINWVSR
ncbi:MAG: P-loop NTPase [Candidatus Aenigmarchaeota archaeon]|nr:P-loop NTPase [Candidatus Aenigmarchaeota archaeon]